MTQFSGFSGTLMSVLQNADFRLIWYVGSVGEFARRMELLVLSWLVLQLTDSYLQLGLILAFNNLSRPMISLYAGYIADRFPRGRVLIVGQFINVVMAAALLAVIAYDIDLIESWHVFAVVFIQGLTKAIEDPSRRTAIVDIVGQRLLVNALSLDVISNNIGKMTGPIVGGIILGAAGFVEAYAFLLVIHVSNLGLMAKLRIPDYRGPAQMEPVVHSLKVAVGYAWHSPALLGLFYITIVMNALAFPVQQFIPAVGRDHLEVGVTLVGLLVAADGFGQLAGAGIMAITRDLRYHGRVFVLGSTGVLLMGIVFVWSPWYALTFGLLTFSGIAQSGFSTMQSAVTMLATPHEMRGRMMGLLSVCIGAGTPLGAFELGAVASAVSIQWAISLNAAAGLLLLLPAMVISPLLWRPLTQAESDPETEAESASGPVQREA